MDLKSYTDTPYHNEELKSLTRYRFNKVRERAKLKTSVSRLVNILFPELETLVPTLHLATVYALLSEFPGARQIATAHLTHLKTVLSDASKDRYDRDTAIEIREAARHSIGSSIPVKSLELQHTIHLISELLGFLRPLMSRANLKPPALMLTWRNEVLAICVTLYSMLLSSFAFGIRHLLHILQKNVLRGSIIMSQSLMRQGSL